MKLCQASKKRMMFRGAKAKQHVLLVLIVIAVGWNLLTATCMITSSHAFAESCRSGGQLRDMTKRRSAPALLGEEENIPQKVFDRCRSTPEKMRHLDQLLRASADALEAANITYWLDSGTLLGAYRFNAYNAFEDDLDLVVEVDSFIKNLQVFRKVLSERIEALGFKPFFKDVDVNRKTYEEDIPQVFMMDTNIKRAAPPAAPYVQGQDPQIDFLPVRFNEDRDRYELLSAYFKGEAPEGFAGKSLFLPFESEASHSSRWVTKHGVLGFLEILGRRYPAPVDVETYCASWYWPTDFMRDIIMRQMKKNFGEHNEFCDNHGARIHASRKEPLAQAMIERNKEIFGELFDKEKCPLCVVLRNE